MNTGMRNAWLGTLKTFCNKAYLSHEHKSLDEYSILYYNNREKVKKK
jgi:hypothetical protein